MRKLILLLSVIVVLSLTACKSKPEYECNIQDHAFIPFFSDENYQFNQIHLGLLNQCNSTLDGPEESQGKINNLYKKIDDKNLSIDPDISGIEAYIDYYSNSRRYPEDLVSYDIFNTYNGTMELAFIYEGYLQMDLFVDYYDKPIEGELNDFTLTKEFYKMRYYVNDDFLYFVQYHNDDGSQFTVTRIYFTSEDKLIYDYLTFYKEDKSYNYEYTYYEEGNKGVQAKYRYYDFKKGMLDIRVADFTTGYIEQYHMSNYINPMFKLQIVNPQKSIIIFYTKEQDKYSLNKEFYDNNGFIYGEYYENYNDIIHDYRYNLKHLKNWDYYFQNNLYYNQEKLTDPNSEVFVNTKIKLHGTMNIYQHFEYLYHSKDGIELPNYLIFNGLSIEQKEMNNLIDEDYADKYFRELLDNQDIKDVELLNLWKTYVPIEFFTFIEKNR